MKMLFVLELNMFILIMLGVLAVKIKMFSEEGKRNMIDFVLYIILPCNIVDSFSKNVDLNITSEFFAIAASSIFLQLLSIVFSRSLYNKVEDKEKRTILQYSTIVSNNSFLGFPLAGSVYGSKGLIYASIFLIFQRINNFSFGISYFTYSGRKDMAKKILLHPCILATIIGVFVLIFHIHLPELVSNPINMLGGCSVPLSMFLIGLSLADVDIKHIFEDLIGYYSAIRLFLIPGIVFLFCLLIGFNELTMGVAVLLSGMPAGTFSVMLGTKYGADVVLAGRCVVFTTILSLVTIPLWCYIVSIVS